MAGRGRWLPGEGGGEWGVGSGVAHGAADFGGDDSPEAHLGGEGKPRTGVEHSPCQATTWPPLPSAESPPKTGLAAHHRGLGALTLRRSSSCSASAAVKQEKIHVRTRETN